LTEAYNQRRQCCLWKGGDGVAHSFNCTYAFVICWHTCFFIL